MLILLSVPISRDMPLYPGTPPVALIPSDAEGRDGPASTRIVLDSHSGTHLDLPRHFCRSGATVKEMLSPENRFHPCYCLDLPASGRVALTDEHVSELLEGKEDAEAVLVRTGSSRLRSEDPQAYAADHPFIDPSLPRMLRLLLPKLRLFGIDAISIAVPDEREAGREAHRAFLCEEPPIMVLEGIDLSSELLAEGPFALSVFPYFHDDLDSTPVVALAELPDR